MQAKINYEDKFLYEHLTFIINEFEEAALRSETREGILLVAHTPLMVMDSILANMSKTLSPVKTKTKTTTSQAVSNPSQTRKKGDSLIVTKENPVTSSSDGFLGAEVPLLDSVLLDTDTISDNLSIDLVGDDAVIDLHRVTFDKDIQALTGTTNLQDYLKDCLGCDARVSFEWQLQPIDLLAPTNKLLKSINLALDSFEENMEPFNGFGDLCNLLNGTKWLCIPDLVTLLMGVKLLFKSYLSTQFKLNLDWTVLIGPLLKVIVNAVSSLLQAVSGVMLGPIDCLSSALKSVATIEKQLSDIGNIGTAVARDTASKVKDSVDFNILYKDVGLTPDAIPRLKTQTRNSDDVKASYSQWSFPSGVSISSKETLNASLQDPRFGNAHWTSKLIVVVNEVRNYLLDLINKVLGSLNSLEGLVTGGLTLQLGNLGALLFLKDMITLIITITKLLKDNPKVQDWCSYLEQHPEILEDALSISGNRVNINSQNRTLILTQGPQIVGTIATCLNERKDTPEALLLNQWIKNLQDAI